MAGQAGKLIGAFQARYGAGAEPRVYRAPGRVNLIGEHTDYNLGFVCPVALDLACRVAVAPNNDGNLRVWSNNVEQECVWAVEDVPGLQPAGDWSDYVAGVAVELHRAGYRIRPMNLLIDSTVPSGGGLSSSASLERSEERRVGKEWRSRWSPDQ